MVYRDTHHEVFFIKSIRDKKFVGRAAGIGAADASCC